MRESLNIRLEGMLSFINDCGQEGFDDSKIEELEAIILECNSLMTKTHTNQVADSIWDTLYDMLKTVKPNSKILYEIWESADDGEAVTEYTELLEKNPMMSIETAKSYTCQAFQDFIDRMPNDVTSYFASYKINGHGIRVVYLDGELVSATTRGRSSGSKDITRHMRILLGEQNDKLTDYGMVEIRGELCLPINRLSLARQFNPSIVSAFSAVASLSKPSATEEEIKLLDFLAYGLIIEGFHFNEREEEFQELENLGFSTPQYALVENATKDELPDLIESLIQSFEESYEEFGYFCDGVVFEVNDRNLFLELGTGANHNLGNIALKVGVWEQVQYYGYVQKILWTKGKTKLSPVAIIGDSPDIIPFDDKDVEGVEKLYWEQIGVLTSQGNKVRRVPLYEPKNIMVLDAYVGEPLYFRYGGEAGVVPCFPDGRLLTEDAATDMLLGEEVIVSQDFEGDFTF